MSRKEEIINKFETENKSRGKIAKELGLSLEYVSRTIMKHQLQQHIRTMLKVILREVKHEKISSEEYKSLNWLYEWIGGRLE